MDTRRKYEKRFLGYRFDQTLNDFVKEDGSTTGLRRKSLMVLKYLHDHVDRVVSKKELFNAVWSESIVSDDSLVQCIAEIRHAIQDKSREIIRTVPKRGYQLVSDSEHQKAYQPVATPDSKEY